MARKALPSSDAEPRRSTDILKQQGMKRTDMDCHMCSNHFWAFLDYDLTGDFQIECPHCGHHHYRAVKDGMVTESRYSTDNRPRTVSDSEDRNLWKARTQPIATATKSNIFLRDLWLGREDF